MPTPEDTLTWSDAEYFAFDAVNATSLKQLLKSPREYQHHLRNPKPKTINMVLGSAIHCLTLEPMHFDSRYAVWDGESRRTKAYREWKERQEMAGRSCTDACSAASQGTEGVCSTHTMAAPHHHHP